MTRRGGTSEVVLQTPDGKYLWWWGLGLLDYVPKGRRRQTETHHLALGTKVNTNTLDGAIRKAALVEAKRRKDGQRQD